MSAHGYTVHRCVPLSVTDGYTVPTDDKRWYPPANSVPTGETLGDIHSQTVYLLVTLGGVYRRTVYPPVNSEVPTGKLLIVVIVPSGNSEIDLADCMFWAKSMTHTKGCKLLKDNSLFITDSTP